MNSHFCPHCGELRDECTRAEAARGAEWGDLDVPSREPEFIARAKTALRVLGEILDEARAAGCLIRLMVDGPDDTADQVWPDRHLHVYPPRRDRVSSGERCAITLPWGRCSREPYHLGRCVPCA